MKTVLTLAALVGMIATIGCSSGSTSSSAKSSTTTTSSSAKAS